MCTTQVYVFLGVLDCHILLDLEHLDPLLHTGYRSKLPASFALSLSPTCTHRRYVPVSAPIASFTTLYSRYMYTTNAIHIVIFYRLLDSKSVPYISGNLCFLPIFCQSIWITKLWHTYSTESQVLWTAKQMYTSRYACAVVLLSNSTPKWKQHFLPPSASKPSEIYFMMIYSFATTKQHKLKAAVSGAVVVVKSCKQRWNENETKIWHLKDPLLSLWEKKTRVGLYTRMGLLGLFFIFLFTTMDNANTWPTLSATWNILKCNRGANLLCQWSSHVGSNRNGKGVEMCLVKGCLECCSSLVRGDYHLSHISLPN